jgi:hypothetical protein
MEHAGVFLEVGADVGVEAGVERRRRFVLRVVASEGLWWLRVNARWVLRGRASRWSSAPTFEVRLYV